MTKSELLAALQDWPDNTTIEIEVSMDIQDPLSNDKKWLRIVKVEPYNDWVDHCLIIAGKITME